MLVSIQSQWSYSDKPKCEHQSRTKTLSELLKLLCSCQIHLLYLWFLARTSNRLSEPKTSSSQHKQNTKLSGKTKWKCSIKILTQGHKESPSKENRLASCQLICVFKICHYTQVTFRFDQRPMYRTVNHAYDPISCL